MRAETMELQRLTMKVARLERQTHRLKLAFAVAFTIAGSVFLLGATSQNTADVITARQLALLGPNGVIRAVLGVTEDGSKVSLAMLDRNGVVRIGLGVDEQGEPGLYLYDDKEALRAGFAISENHPSLQLHDEDGKGRVGLQISDVGPALSLHDVDEKLRVNLGLLLDQPVLILRGRDGKDRATLSLLLDEPTLKLIGTNGKEYTFPSTK